MASGKQSMREILDRYRPDTSSYEQLREQLHSNPELSTIEENTASLIVSHLHSLEVYTIHSSIGGHGVVAVLRNGPGKNLLLRADMDALPIREETGLPFASTITQTDPADGKRKPVMHACGHDLHVASLLGAASFFASTQNVGIWAGTIILLFQPAEERATGAQAMLDDGLYKRIGVIPDLLLAQHVGPLRAGFVGIRSGPIMTASDSLKITLFGRGAHGSMPDQAVDPVLLAAHVVLRLQEIVSRELKPGVDFAIVTVGSLSAGDAENVISDRAELKLNIRTLEVNVREKVLKSVERIVRAECSASGSPKEPEFKEISRFPPTINDVEIVEKLRRSFGEAFDDFNGDCERWNASEDFSLLATQIGKPYAYWVVGCIDQATWDKSNGEGIPGNHSPLFTPVTQPTLTTSIDALCAGALAFMSVQVINDL